MDTLLNPESGLIIWTIISFLVLVGILKAFAWGPLLHAIEAREEGMRREREAAEKARQEAERIQKELADQFAAIDAKGKELLSQAGKEGEALRAKIRAVAEEEAQAISEKTRAQLEEEKRRLIAELRKEVAGLSVLAAERLIHKSIDAGVKKSVMDEFLKDLSAKETKN
ncbi:MAG TPA: F0F1 ATP synthase subunit B [Elusimicrobiota bacterium]|nr:F0F1 ATP synthase subunit B [Elusimicrobiota bacterium]